VDLQEDKICCTGAVDTTTGHGSTLDQPPYDDDPPGDDDHDSDVKMLRDVEQLEADMLELERPLDETGDVEQLETDVLEGETHG
jgi:hypothetical protein